MTPEEQAERASLTAALVEYHAHPGRYLLPTLNAGSWTLPLHEKPPTVTGGYTYQPPKDWLEAPDAGAAWDIYRLQKGKVGYPVPGTDPATGQPIWLLHPRMGKIGTLDPKGMSMGDFLALQAQATGRVTGGSSAKNAHLTDQDRVRIAEEARKKKEREAEEQRQAEVKAAAKVAAAAAKVAEEIRRREAQGSLFELEGA